MYNGEPGMNLRLQFQVILATFRVNIKHGASCCARRRVKIGAELAPSMAEIGTTGLCPAMPLLLLDDLHDEHDYNSGHNRRQIIFTTDL